MEKLIRLNSYPVRDVLKILLQDKTTKKNIIWATNSYKEFGVEYEDSRQMMISSLIGLNPILIQPRIMKSFEEQSERTKKKAEVFTPSWLCNKMNNYCDEEWFGYKDVFNVQSDNEWTATEGLVKFPEKKSWKKYVDSRRLEITCGEAPYLVSRYDASTGEIIKIRNRIGILDRKLRIVNENTDNEKDWFEWVLRAYQSTYGYEYQGDNLLIARINLLLTFADYTKARWYREPTIKELSKIANIISWNIWQMDGLKGTVPLGVPPEQNEQLSFYDSSSNDDNNEQEKSPICKIYDWRRGNSVSFDTLRKER